MNGLFLTCLLVSASAVCGQRSVSAQIETLSQRLSSVGIEVGKAFSATDHFRARVHSLGTGITSSPGVVHSRDQRLPQTAHIASMPVLRSLRLSAPIRGPSI